MLRHLKKTLITAVISIGFINTTAYADIIISGTRIIYDENKKDISVRLDNKGQNPLLVQDWIDTGEENVDPAKIKTPFTAIPPVSRIEPKRGQTIKITYTGTTALPKDRESVFWFNVLEVPPKADASKADNTSLLQLAFRTRVKLFYRPSNLKGAASESVDKLKWHVVREQGQTVLRVDNPTAFYVSFNNATFDTNGKKYNVDITMVAPFAQSSFPIKGLTAPHAGKLDFRAINDYGGMIKGSVSL